MMNILPRTEPPTTKRIMIPDDAFDRYPFKQWLDKKRKEKPR
jgi:hypothetical protein